jgi:hypothetical protein
MLYFIWIGFCVACGSYLFELLRRLLVRPGELRLLLQSALIILAVIVGIGLVIFAFLSVPPSWLDSLHDWMREISIPEGLAALGLLALLLLRGRFQSKPVRTPDVQPEQMKRLMGL